MRVQLMTGQYVLKDNPSGTELQRIANGERVMLPARTMNGQDVTICSDHVLAWSEEVEIPLPQSEVERAATARDRDRYLQALRSAEQQLQVTPINVANATALATIRSVLADRNTSP